MRNAATIIPPATDLKTRASDLRAAARAARERAARECEHAAELERAAELSEREASKRN